MTFSLNIEEAKKLFPNYRFVAALPKSCQKVAFHAIDENGNDVCLKIIPPNSERSRLDREIQAMQNLNHPNVVNLIEYTFSSKPGFQKHYIVEEFIEGTDLKDILLPKQPWDKQKVSLFFSKICDGLAALKKQRIVHRDLAPKNIRVRPDETPVIIDFGLARHLGLPDLTLTVDGASIGTPIYFSPEQFQGTKRDIDHRTDLFALGIIMYEALTGESPFYFEGITLEQLKQAVCVSEVHLNKESYQSLDKNWKLILAKLLEKERSRRPADASLVSQILRKLGGE